MFFFFPFSSLRFFFLFGFKIKMGISTLSFSSLSLSRKRISFRSDEEAEKEREKKKRREKRRERKTKKRSDVNRNDVEVNDRAQGPRTTTDRIGNTRSDENQHQRKTKRNVTLSTFWDGERKIDWKEKNKCVTFPFGKKKKKKEEEKLCRLFQKKICPQLQASSFEIIVAILLSPAIER